MRCAVCIVFGLVRSGAALEFADRVLCELGPPDLLHQLEDVTAGTALSA
jgi:hypothetical protein